MPLTAERAKPAVSVAGKYRLIDIPLSNCINSGIRKVYVVTQFMSESLHRHIMQTYQFDSFSEGFVDILAAAQKHESENWFQGTADAVRGVLRHITYYRAEATLILSGDHLYRMDYSKLVAFHLQNKADITLAVHPVLREDAPRMGLLRADASGRISEFSEKPGDEATIERFCAPDELLSKCGIDEKEPRYLASMGIYVFDPLALIEILARGPQVDFGKEVIPSAIPDYNVMAWPFAGYWKDIGTIGSFFAANIALAQPEPPFRLYEPGWPIHTRTRSLPPSRIIRSDIRDSLVVEGSDITGASISDSVIGLRSIVREGTSLSEVVMLGADYYEGEGLLQNLKSPPAGVPPLGIGPNCKIERAIIDKNARIGEGVVITSKAGVDDKIGPNYWIRDGITVVPKGAVVKPSTRI